MNMNFMRRSVLSVAAIIALGGVAGACTEFLKAENPGAIQEPALGSTDYIQLMVNGVQGEFQRMYPQVTYYNSLWTDELRNHGVFFEERLYDRRVVDEINGTHSFFVYSPLQRSVWEADSIRGRLAVLLADSADKSTRTARVSAYAGYNYIILGEMYCAAPVNGSAPKTPTELFRDFAIPRFNEAIAIATASKTFQQGGLPVPPARILAADSIIRWAQVGTARAALDLGDKPTAIAYAQAVVATTDTAFMFRVYTDSTFAALNGTFGSRVATGSGSKTGSISNTPYAAMVDRRVPRPATTEGVQDASQAIVPNAGRSFNASVEYTTPTATPAVKEVGADYSRTGWMRLASYREARYIVAEAEGNTPANVAFLDAQRALGGDAALGGTAPLVSPTDAEYFASLRDQRRREFYADNHRIGDLRRYITQYNVNEFQTGLYPGTSTGEQYGTQTCLPLTLAENQGNPNIPKP